MSRQRALDIAIVDKVESILKNADDIVKIHIGIFGGAGELPAIRYSIEETIRPAVDVEIIQEERGVSD